MKCLVTGAAGFIGSNLTERLLREGFDVVGLDDLSSGKLENLDGCRNGFEFVEGTILDQKLLGTLMSGVDLVFHLAALVSVPQSVEEPWAAHSINVDGTVNVLLAASNAHVKRVVFSSSAAIYGEVERVPLREDDPAMPMSPYALNKWHGEHYLELFSREYGLSTVGLRYFNVYGNRQDPEGMYAAAIPKLLGRVLKGKHPIIFGDGEQTRDFVHVDDVVAANVRAATIDNDLNGDVFNVGSGTQLSVNALLAQILELTGVQVEPEFEPPRPGDVRHSVAAIEKAKHVLQHEPKVQLAEGLQRSIAWYESVIK